MDVLRKRLNEFREEEDDLRSKVSDIENQIKCVVDATHKVNSEQYELATKEMLLKQKCQMQNDRLKDALNRLSDHRDSHDHHSRKLENLNNKNYSQDSRIDELEAELMRLRNECLEVQTRVDETVIHLKHVEFAKENAEKRANATESKVQDLESQSTSTLEALRRAELNDIQYLSTDDLEMKEKSLREQLQRSSNDDQEPNKILIDAGYSGDRLSTNEIVKKFDDNVPEKSNFDDPISSVADPHHPVSSSGVSTQCGEYALNRVKVTVTWEYDGPTLFRGGEDEVIKFKDGYQHRVFKKRRGGDMMERKAIDTYENSERNILTLDRQIKSRKAELLKQRTENEKLKKEMELFFKEMHDI